MKRRAAILGTGVLVALWAVVSIRTGTLTDADGGAMPGDVDTVAGKALYAQACATCHGEALEGQENWRSPGEDGLLPAPPHDATGHTWHHGDRMLFGYTKLGGREMMAARGVAFDSGMPGFGDRLTDREIRNILGYIKSTWPKRIRDMQAMRTESERRERDN